MKFKTVGRVAYILNGADQCDAATVEVTQTDLHSFTSTYSDLFSTFRAGYRRSTFQ